jgi:hypothetical protein
MIVDRPEQVDATNDAVRKAGGRITKEPVDGEFFVGRSAYFADPEDNYWEVAWAPADNAVGFRAAKPPPWCPAGDRVSASIGGSNERELNEECTTDPANASKADLPT